MHELFIILEGTARMVVDGHSHDLQGGDAIAVAPGEEHEIANKSTKPTILLVAGWMTMLDR